MEARPPEQGFLATDASSAPALILYWRPACGFCAALRRRLRHAGLIFEEVDIWHDRAGAAFVRSVTGGDETVPTVIVGASVLVNPTAREVLDTVRREAPWLLLDIPRKRPSWSRLFFWRTRAT
jgi:glutaredoxin-like protein